MRRVETSTLHRGVAGSEHSFMAVPVGGNKLHLLMQARLAAMHLLSGRPRLRLAHALNPSPGSILLSVPTKHQC